MQLPDFLKNEQLTQLKAKLRIDADVYGRGTSVPVFELLTREEAENLISGVGVDVSWDDLTILENGSFVYKGVRVLLYIRDVHAFGGRDAGPRYHLATCRAIERMHAQGRIERYVVANQLDGIFQVNIMTNGGRSTEMRHLSVCQNCLEMLRFDDFGWHLPPAMRASFAANFTPNRFFQQYPQSPHTRVPSNNADDAPLNDYTKDFKAISRRLRSESGWRCSQCQRTLSGSSEQKFLQVHHKDGNRWDNRSENLEVLCIGCHVVRPSHSHMMVLPIFLEYKRKYGL